MKLLVCVLTYPHCIRKTAHEYICREEDVCEEVSVGNGIILCNVTISMYHGPCKCIMVL